MNVRRKIGTEIVGIGLGLTVVGEAGTSFTVNDTEMQRMEGVPNNLE